MLFLGIQQVENLFLVPRISGKAVELHPAVIMVVLVVGNQIAGFWGMVLAVPVTAIIRDVFKYLYLRLQDEPVSPVRRCCDWDARRCSWMCKLECVHPPRTPAIARSRCCDPYPRPPPAPAANPPLPRRATDPSPLRSPRARPG